MAAGTGSLRSRVQPASPKFGDLGSGNCMKALTNRFRVSGTIPHKLTELGLSPLAILRQAGLPMSLLAQKRIIVTTEELFALYRSIAEISHDPGIGLKLGT